MLSLEVGTFLRHQELLDVTCTLKDPGHLNKRLQSMADGRNTDNKLKTRNRYNFTNVIFHFLIP